MLYLKWFDAVSALCASSKVAEEAQNGLFFLGNMLMPAETHIIRLHANVPKVFTPENKILSTRGDLLAENFYLPGAGVVVEDEISAIGFVDMAQGKRGVEQRKLFVYIENKDSSRKTMQVKTFAEMVNAAMFELYFPEDGLWTVWGLIDDVVNLNIHGKVVNIHVATWGMAFFNNTEVFDFSHSTWFHHYLKREQVPAGKPEDAKFSRFVADYMNGLGQNLQQALLQVAYHNALVEAK